MFTTYWCDFYVAAKITVQSLSRIKVTCKLFVKWEGMGQWTSRTFRNHLLVIGHAKHLSYRQWTHLDGSARLAGETRRRHSNFDRFVSLPKGRGFSAVLTGKTRYSLAVLQQSFTHVIDLAKMQESFWKCEKISKWFNQPHSIGHQLALHIVFNINFPKEVIFRMKSIKYHG